LSRVEGDAIGRLAGESGQREGRGQPDAGFRIGQQRRQWRGGVEEAAFAEHPGRGRPHHGIGILHQPHQSEKFISERVGWLAAGQLADAPDGVLPHEWIPGFPTGLEQSFKRWGATLHQFELCLLPYPEVAVGQQRQEFRFRALAHALA